MNNLLVITSYSIHYTKLYDTDDRFEYKSVDASLWFIWAIQQYCLKTNDCKFMWDTYHKAIKQIIKYFSEGTLHNIHMLPNGLIYAGEPGIALTWMNSVVDGKPVTPRTGCTVEVNALWYNALCFSAELAEKSDEPLVAKRWT